MGRSGMKRRRRKHLPKVGTAPERAYAQKHERRAVTENFGIHQGQATGWTRIVVWILVIAVVIGGLAGAIALAFAD